MERADGKLPNNFSQASSANALFDASQYEFFGQNSMGEVDLGGLEDGEEDSPAFASVEEDEYHLFDRGELNRVVTGPRNSGVIGDRSGSFSRKSSSAAEWAQDGEYLNWMDQNMYDTEDAHEGKRWSSQPHLSSVPVPELKPLYRTSTYPQQQPQPHHFSSEPIVGSKSTFTSYPPPGERCERSLPGHLKIPAIASGSQ